MAAAARLRERHGLTTDLRAEAPTWDDALRLEIDRIEQSGLLVLRSGIVGNNTHRPLDVREFRGFAMADPYAPLIFLNGRDGRAAQMFTLIHELVHVWLGQSGVSNLTQTMPSDHHTERYSNAVAAEVLVPEAMLRDRWQMIEHDLDTAAAALTRQFKVSSLVILRRLHDIGALDWATFRTRYPAEEARFAALADAQPGGGDFYRTQRTRSSTRFATALIEDTLEGRTSWRDALKLLGIKKIATFKEMARNLGLPA